MAPDELRDFPLPDPRPPDGIAAGEIGFAIDPAIVAVPETARREPVLDARPIMVGFGDAADDDDDDEAAAPAEPAVKVATPRPRYAAWGMAGSLGVHLLPLLFLLYWDAPSARIERPIPVTLVLEAPRAKPQPPPKPLKEARPPPGRLASANIGDPTAKAAKSVTPEPPADAPDKMQAAPKAPPRKTPPGPELVSALPKPAPMPGNELRLVEPALPALAPAVPARPQVRHEAAARSTPHPPAERPLGRIPGPAATQDEYLAYANALIRRNQELIPASLLQGRSGEAVIAILVLADGQIARVVVKESSGYPEIDRRAEQMVAAVKRFPPLPQWFRGTSMLLSYHMLFGDRIVLP